MDKEDPLVSWSLCQGAPGIGHHSNTQHSAVCDYQSLKGFGAAMRSPANEEQGGVSARKHVFTGKAVSPRALQTYDPMGDLPGAPGLECHRLE